MQLKLKSSKNAAFASGLNSTQLLYYSSLDMNDFQSLIRVGEWKGGFITVSEHAAFTEVHSHLKC